MAASFKTSMIAAMVIFASMMVMALVPCAEAQAVSVSISSPAPAPAPAPAPTSDGTAIDQGIAYVLMVLALVLTYIIHVSDILI